MSQFITQQQAQSAAPHISLQGDWVLANMKVIEKSLEKSVGKLRIKAGGKADASQINHIDTSGAWVLHQLVQKGWEIINLAPPHQKLLTLIHGTASAANSTPPEKQSFLESLGRAAVNLWQELNQTLSFIGEAAIKTFGAVKSPAMLRWQSIARFVRETGVNAVFIVALIAFLISVVLAYQGAQQLTRFGAEIYAIDMVAISLFREMGVLLTAIMVAGRSGSAFAAEIGAMKVNEEVDAMRVIGIEPFGFLVIPRIIGLLIALPILTVIADFAGFVGGGIVSYYQIGISPEQYIDKFNAAVSINDFMVGISKTPIFALIIAVIGCREGLKVTGSAESLGRHTTSAVVQSIFMVLVADAVFSILFTKMGV